MRRASTVTEGQAVLAAGAVTLGVWLALFLWYWAGGLPYDVPSGVWSAFAADWADGLLYRPVQEGAAYGGTRYMPLFFGLQATLLRLGIPIVAAGLALTIASSALFVGGVYATARALGVSQSVAGGAALLALGCTSVQLLTLATKGDLLAAALVLWGFHAALRRRLPLAALLWTLAFATKLTALWGPGAFVLWSWGRGERREGTRAALLTAAGCALVVALSLWLSHGRMLDAFAVALGGGGGLRHALGAPWWLLRSARQDPVLIALLLLAGLACVRRVRRNRWDAPSAWYLAALLATLLLFASAGIDTNHFPDVLAASLLLLAAELRGRELKAGAALFAAAQLATLVPGAPSPRHWFDTHEAHPTIAKVARLQATLPPNARVLSENPLLPLVWGTRPDVADPYNLRLLAERDPAARREFLERLRSGYYQGVILVDWDGELAGRLGGAGDVGELQPNFPRGTLNVLNEHYRIARVERPYVLLLRKAGP